MTPFSFHIIIPSSHGRMWHGEAGDARAKEACLHALKLGYKLVDTAQYYGNEADVGAAVADYTAAGGARPYLVTKLLAARMGAADARAALKESLAKLRVDAVDLYLVHSPKEGKVVKTWAELCKLRSEGFCKAVGVSNFSIEHLEGLAAAGLPVPEVNQIELHPWLPQDETVAYCRAHGIAVMGYCPLARGNRFATARDAATGDVQPNPHADATLAAVAAEADATEAQVALRWSLQKGYITIPKSTNAERLRENACAAALFGKWAGGALSGAQMARLDKECPTRECRASKSVGWMDTPWADVRD